MKEYKVVSGTQLTVLEKEVNALINQGWKLSGGIAMAYKHEHSDTPDEHIPGHLAYAQALEKE